MNKWLTRYLEGEQGNVLILVAAAMVALIGFTALAIDGGRLYSEKSMLQKAADAGALAGAQELPLDSTEAERFAKEVAEQNGVPQTNSVVEFASDKMWIRVTTSSIVEHTFGKIFGITEIPITATAKVKLNPLTSGTGVVPIGVDIADYKVWKNCTEITLKQETPSGKNLGEECNGSNLGSGNTGALIISGNGATDYENDLEKGATVTVSKGDILEIKEGTMKQPNKRAVEERVNSCKEIYTYNATTFLTNPPPVECAQIVTVPIYSIYEEKNNKVFKVKIEGFAKFFLLGTGDGGKEIIGRFMEFTASGDSSPTQPNYGAYGYKLVE
ncbi:pilus assembly protein TadG-related protein [Lysinibacillus antri]|uniref:Putative Flp pilus-assembly TadG-like N-terminal domain-containing protein n=1 Tax=Lysinibacillus antri TaxID=2498145 RepID=A0A3S0QNN1_9BACI|nr:pilus assembly protein TadG-related protein [Lysinibacillus antri]RUL49579.1 hypothetical protein EK386_14915 [Lysinibacillus antri]